MVFLDFSVCVPSRVRFFAAPRTVTHQTSLTPMLAGRFFTISATWEAPSSPIEYKNKLIVFDKLVEMKEEAM